MGRFIVVTANPAVDVTYSVREQIIGDTVRVQRIHRRAGGKGINVAMILHSLGRDVLAIQPLGGLTGDWIADELTRERLPAESISTNVPTRTTITVTDGHLHPTVLSEPGPELTPLDWMRLAAAVSENAAQGDWVAIAGSLPAGEVTEVLERLVRAARTAGARVLVDASGPSLMRAARMGVDVVKANEGEALHATNTPTIPDAMNVLSAHGSAVLISTGAKGLIYRDASSTRALIQPAVPNVSGNPTGAGDAATAGFLAAVADRHTLPSALTWAAVCGAAAVEADTAGHIDTSVLAELAGRLPVPPSSSLVPHQTEENPT